MVHEKLCKIYCIKTSSNLCFGYLLELPHWGNSNKYSKHMFYEEIIMKQGLCYISFCPLRLLYNRKFILMATSPETYAVVVTRVHCKIFTWNHFLSRAMNTDSLQIKLFIQSNKYVWLYAINSLVNKTIFTHLMVRHSKHWTASFRVSQSLTV